MSRYFSSLLHNVAVVMFMFYMSHSTSKVGDVKEIEALRRRNLQCSVNTQLLSGYSKHQSMFSPREVVAGYPWRIGQF